MRPNRTSQRERRWWRGSAQFGLAAFDARGEGDDFFVEGVEHFRFGDGAFLFALDADDSAAFAGEDGNVGAFGFAGVVGHAANRRDDPVRNDAVGWF